MEREDLKRRRTASNPALQKKRDELAKKIRARIEAQKKAGTVTDEQRKKNLEAYKQRVAARKAEEEKKKVQAGKPKPKKPVAGADRFEKARQALAAMRAKATEVDENGTPAVGDAPKNVDPNAVKVPKPGEDGAPAPAPEPVAAPAPEPVPASTEAEGNATILVQVNEKLDEIEKRAEVDKVVKTELEQIKETLTGVAASLKAVKSSKPDVLSKHESVVIADFLSKIDAAFKKDVIGFEATACLKDREAFDKLVSASRIAIDIASEKAHSVLASYIQKNATATDVKNAVREVKAAYKEFQAIKSVTAIFKKEASISSSDSSHIKRIVGHVQDLVVAGKIEASQISSLVSEYMTLSPIEFRSVVSTMSRIAGNGVGYPEKIHSIQSSAREGIDSLESVFDV